MAIKLGVLLGLLPVVPSFFESCIKLCVIIILVCFTTLTGGATTDEVRIILLAPCGVGSVRLPSFE